MFPRKRRSFAAVLAGLAVAALPAQSQACWLFDCFGHHNRTTFYAPAVAAPACNTCVPQTVSYVPQTAYRPLVTTTPVTALRPVTATDPCTGCATTVMHPTTSYMQRTVMMPYTTYRPVTRTSLFAPAVAAPVIAAPACPTGACAPAASTTYYQPAVSAPVIAQPGYCAANATQATVAPMASAVTAPALGTATPAYGAMPGPAPRTFNNASESPSDRNEPLKPIPDVKENGVKSDATSLPRLTDPLNRTTSKALSGWSYTPVALKDARPAPQVSRIQKLDDSGWEAAR
jgi:hypothetical protein